ncbi:mitochondrial inner membrane protease ATP23 homolog [Diretmus argenteus]
MRVVSYNCRGLRESWLAQQDLGKLNSLHPHFHGAGESTTDLSTRIAQSKKSYSYSNAKHRKSHCDSSSSSGSRSPVSKDRHFSCEDCDGTVSGGFDAAVSQIVLCQNNIHQQSHMNRVVTHELIHAFDHCRAHVDWFDNFRHLACSEIRAASLSGDCSFSSEAARLNFGLKQHHQECVRGRALRSILAVRKIDTAEAEKIVVEVFDTCFNDHAPFGRIPHGAKDAKFAHRHYENRDRYYANL